MTTVHDHQICEFTVDVVGKQIRLRTAFPELSGPTFADVLFDNVEAYVFDGEAFGTILFGIMEENPVELYRERAEQLQREYAKDGSHSAWVVNESEAALFLVDSRVRGFRVTSSIGLEGAVWAAGLTIQASTT